MTVYLPNYCFFFSFVFYTHLLSSFWAGRGHRCRAFSPRFLPSTFIAHRVQQSHCSSVFHRVLRTHALALSANQSVLKKKSPRIYTSMHSGGFELTKLTYTRHEDNLIHHRGDRLTTLPPLAVENIIKCFYTYGFTLDISEPNVCKKMIFA